MIHIIEPRPLGYCPARNVSTMLVHQVHVISRHITATDIVSTILAITEIRSAFHQIMSSTLYQLGHAFIPWLHYSFMNKFYMLYGMRHVFFVIALATGVEYSFMTCFCMPFTYSYLQLRLYHCINCIDDFLHYPEVLLCFPYFSKYCHYLDKILYFLL